MFLRRTRCLEAWKELRTLLAAHAGQIILYFLFSIVLAIAIGIVVVFVVILTCCCAGCLMAIPYLGTVLLLPVIVFKRCYSLYFLAQFGRAFDVYAPAPTPATAPLP